jgi:hypothetical protein
VEWLPKLLNMLTAAPKQAQKYEMFDPQGGGYDYGTARYYGMGPTGTGENAGHWGSVAPASPQVTTRYGLPPESYAMLKGRQHPTWDKGVQGEVERGYKVIQRGGRYYSVPQGYEPPTAGGP